MEEQTFTIATADFDTSLLPAGARARGTPQFREAINAFLRQAFDGFGGRVTILVDDHRITVTWNPDPARQSPVDFIVAKLQRGQRAEGIQLLELMRSREPDNVDALYNLGIALSDAGRLNQAERYLRQVVELAPTFVNGLVGLGVALSRQQKNDEATVVLQRAAPAIPQGPANQPGGPQPGFLNSEKIGCRLSRLRVFGASHS